MHLLCFSLITPEIFQPGNRYKGYFVEEVLMDIFSTKEIIKRGTLEISEGKKNAVSIYIAFSDQK